MPEPIPGAAQTARGGCRPRRRVGFGRRRHAQSRSRRLEAAALTTCFRSEGWPGTRRATAHDRGPVVSRGCRIVELVSFRRGRGSVHSVSSSTLRQRKTPPTTTTVIAAKRSPIDPVWLRSLVPLEIAWSSRRTTFRRVDTTLGELLSRKERVTRITWARSEMSAFGLGGCAVVESGYCAETAVEPPAYPEIAQDVSGNARSSPVLRHSVTPSAQRGSAMQIVLHGRNKISCLLDNPEHPRAYCTAAGAVVQRFGPRKQGPGPRGQ